MVPSPYPIELNRNDSLSRNATSHRIGRTNCSVFFLASTWSFRQPRSGVLSSERSPLEHRLSSDLSGVIFRDVLPFGVVTPSTRQPQPVFLANACAAGVGTPSLKAIFPKVQPARAHRLSPGMPAKNRQVDREPSRLQRILPQRAEAPSPAIGARPTHVDAELSCVPSIIRAGISSQPTSSRKSGMFLHL